MSDQSYIITTGRNGRLDHAKSADINDIVATARAGRKIVVHLHGGLVDETSGLRTARQISGTYIAAGASPVFVVWQSGLVDVLRHNLDEILGEDLFKRMLKWVLQFAVGKLWQEPGQRAAGALPLPNDMRVRGELAHRGQGMEPFAGTGRLAGLTEVDHSERQQLEEALWSDEALLADVNEVLATRHPETVAEGSRGVTVRRQASRASLIDPEALDGIDRGEGGERGIVSLTWLAKKCGMALVRVIQRFRADTDHGVYPTVVEELLREFYVGNAGGAVWSAMKKETLDAFDAAPDCGGRLLLDGLASALADGARPSITLVGHSTGAVFIDNLLNEVSRGRNEGYRPWPDDARFHVALLAPASTYEHFTTMLDRSERLISELRMFTMDDVSEAADRLAGPAYPRSLLYFISGALERDAGGSSAWAPVVGMARYREDAYQSMDMLRRGRTYLNTDRRVVLSPTAADAPAGARAGATSHSAFDEDPMVLDSLTEMIRSA